MLSQRGTPKWIAPLLVIILVVAALSLAREILIPIALATLLAFLLTPICSRLERLHIPRPIAIAIVMAVVISAVGAAGWIIEGQAYQLASHLPEYKSSIIAKLQSFRVSHGRMLGEASKAIADVGREIGGTPPAGAPASLDAAAANPGPISVKVVEVPSPPFEYARSLFTPLLGPVATAAIVIIFSIFMLLKREDLRDRLVKLLGERSMHITTPALDDAAQRVTRYLLLQTVVNGSVGLIVGLGLLLLGVPGALVWGLLTTLLRFVPYIGTWIAAAFPIILSLAVAPDFKQPIMVAALIAAVEITAGQFVEPLLFSSGTGVSSIAILASALFWTWLWGPVGLLLATPLTVCLAVIGRHIPRFSFLETLLGDGVALRPEARLYQRLLAGDHEEAALILRANPAATPTDLFDTLLLPAMRLAEADRHREQLDDDQQRTILELAALLIEDVSAHPRGTIPAAIPGPLIACIASRDAADELACRMVARQLDPAYFSTSIISSDSLTGETIERIAALAPAAICISALPPVAALHARVLCKRLRQRFPDLPIVVGLWDASIPTAAARSRLGDLGTEYVVTSIAQALATLESLVPRVTTAHDSTPTGASFNAQPALDAPATPPQSNLADAHTPVSTAKTDPHLSPLHTRPA